MCPQLLVSTRNAEEARAAVAGGCDIIDVKEPSRGSLGMADPGIITSIVDFAIHYQIGSSVSCALGEVLDWDESATAIPNSVSFVKLGLAELDSHHNWKTLWRDTRRRFNDESGRQLNWIAVVYADWNLANSPHPSDILDAIRSDCADGNGCVGVLVDTFTKSEKRLFDWFTIHKLAEFVQSARQLGLLTAVAGRLSVADIPSLLTVQPDIIAIRSAACVNSERNATVSSAAVRRFRDAIEDEFLTSCPAARSA